MKTDCSGVLHLPEDVVDGVAQETFPVVRRQKFGPQYCHELLKVHLAVPCGVGGGTQDAAQRDRDSDRRGGIMRFLPVLFPLAKTKQTGEQTGAPGAPADSHPLSPLRQVLALS